MGNSQLCRNEDLFDCVSKYSGSASVFVLLKFKHDGLEYLFSSVYGPGDDPIKLNFRKEIRDIRTNFVGPWVLCGDFNIVRF